MVNKLDFLQWRNSPITQQLFSDIVEQLDTYMGSLMLHAGTNQLEDRRTVGVIEGLKSIIEWKPQFDEDDDDADSSGTPGAS